MQTIVFSSQKGGSGKTTLCAHLAVEAERAGAGPVCVIDTDPQGTLATWHGRRAAESPQRADLPFDQLVAGLSVLRTRGAAYCFIDTPPSRTDDTRALYQLADLVIVPIRPSPSDLWAAVPTVELLRQERIPYMFVLNQTKAQARITAQVAAALSKHGQVAPEFVGDRTAYAGALTDGRTAPEVAPKGPAAIEMAALWASLRATLTLHSRQE